MATGGATPGGACASVDPEHAKTVAGQRVRHRFERIRAYYQVVNALGVPTITVGAQAQNLASGFVDRLGSVGQIGGRLGLEHQIDTGRVFLADPEDLNKSAQ